MARSNRSDPICRQPPQSRIVDGKGHWVTPGLIDVHSHLGVYPSPGVEANSDGNEANLSGHAQCLGRALSLAGDPGFRTALAGGITSMQILPGSANLIGGRSVVLKNVPSVTYQGMKFPGAPQGLRWPAVKIPSGFYGERNTFPSTRMGNVAGYREQWVQAQEYLRDQQEYEKKHAAANKDAKPPKRDIKLDTLAAVLKGDIIVHMHCYRADEMAPSSTCRTSWLPRAAFHHAVEAYKVADLLAEQGVCAAMWADWWGFKMRPTTVFQKTSRSWTRRPMAVQSCTPTRTKVTHLMARSGGIVNRHAVRSDCLAASW